MEARGPEFNILRRVTDGQTTARESLAQELDGSPIPREEILDHLAVGRVLLLAEMYRQFLDVHGSVLQFGVRWGRDLAILQALREVWGLENVRLVRTPYLGFPSYAVLD